MVGGKRLGYGGSVSPVVGMTGRYLGMAAVAIAGLWTLLSLLELPAVGTALTARRPSTPRVTVVEASGATAAQLDGARRFGLAAGDRIQPPATLTVGSGPARLVVDDGATRLLAFDGARVQLGRRLRTFGLDRGGVLAHAKGGAVINARGAGTSVRGETVGVRVEGAEATVVVLTGPALVERIGQRSLRVEEGPVVIEPGAAEPAPVVDRLTVEVVEVLRLRRKIRVTVEASPGAIAHLWLGELELEQRVPASGTVQFRARRTGETPVVEIRDALGRRARPGAPSRTVKEVRAMLSEGPSPTAPAGATASEARSPRPAARPKTVPKAAAPHPTGPSAGRPAVARPPAGPDSTAEERAAPRDRATGSGGRPAKAPSGLQPGRRSGTPEFLEVDVDVGGDRRPPSPPRLR